MKELLKKLPNCANIITGLGFILAAWVIFLVFDGLENPPLVLSLFVVAGATDLFDGLIARKYGLQTVIGALLDRLRDKILICPLIYRLASRWPLWTNGILCSLVEALMWLTLIIEAALVVSAVVGFIKKMDIKSSHYGKRKMFFQFLTVVLWITACWMRKIAGDYFLINFLVYATVLFFLIAVVYMFLSLIGYLERWYFK